MLRMLESARTVPGPQGWRNVMGLMAGAMSLMVPLGIITGRSVGGLCITSLSVTVAAVPHKWFVCDSDSGLCITGSVSDSGLCHKLVCLCQEFDIF